MKMVAVCRKKEVVFYGIGVRIVTLKARRDNLLFNQLRFEYGDKVAQVLFEQLCSSFGLAFMF